MRYAADRWYKAIKKSNTPHRSPRGGPRLPKKFIQEKIPQKESAKHRFVSVCERAFFFLDKYVYTPNRNPLI